MNEYPLEMPQRECNIAIVASEFNHFIVQQLVDGAFDALERNGVSESNITEARPAPEPVQKMFELLQMQELPKQFELFDVTLQGNKALAKDDTVNP